MYRAGKYKFQVTGQGFTQAKSGNPQFFIVGKPTGLIDHKDPSQIYECDDYERTIKLTITDKTIERVLSDLRKIGFAGSKFAELDPGNSKCHSFIGQEIDVQCSHEAGQNDPSKLYERWELPYEPKAREPAVSDKSVAARLDALFGKKLSEVNGGARKPAARKQAATVPSISEGDGSDVPDSEIPF